MAYQLIWKGEKVEACFHGNVTNSELNAITSEFYGNKRFDNARYLLINFLDVTSFAASEFDLMAIGAMDSAASISNPKIKVAMVSDKEEVLKLLSSHNKGAKNCAWPIEMFSSKEEAEKWLESSNK